MSESDVNTGNRVVGRVLLIGGPNDVPAAGALLRSHPRVDLVAAYVPDDAVGGGAAGGGTDPEILDDLAGEVTVRKIARLDAHASELRDLKPDLIIVMGFDRSVPAELLAVPSLGVIGFRSDFLPLRRGQLPSHWAVFGDSHASTVTMFYLPNAGEPRDVIARKVLAPGRNDRMINVIGESRGLAIGLLRENLDRLLDGKLSATERSAPGGLPTSVPAERGDEEAGVAEVPAIARPRFLFRDLLSQTVLCVVAHPDDEVLGVGGTLALHAEAGGAVHVLIASEGEAGKVDTPACDTRRECAVAAADALGIRELLFYDFPDQELDAVPLIEIIKVIESAIEKYRPAIVYTHHGGDANSDHRVVFQATLAACRPISRFGSYVQQLLVFETPSSTEQSPPLAEYTFSPSTFVDVESTWEKKVRALEAYRTEMVGGRHPRGMAYVEALARVRGGQCGYALAEAFTPLRTRITPSAGSKHV